MSSDLWWVGALVVVGLVMLGLAVVFINWVRTLEAVEREQD